MSMSAWSRGMIPASGAGGPGFDPRSGPRIEIYFAEIHHGTTTFYNIGDG